MLRQVNNFAPAQLASIAAGLVKVNGHELIADFWGKLTVVYLAVGGGHAHLVIGI